MLPLLLAIFLAAGFGAGVKARHGRPASMQPQDPTTSHYEVAPPTTVPRGIVAERQPWPVRLMVHPLRTGMFIGLPIVDTDPNRGVTTGIMPIWVLQEGGGERIKEIWAPSVTYNKTFHTTSTVRYYTYPTRDSNLQLRGSLSEVTNREAVGDWHDRDFLDSGTETGLRLQYDVDGSRRFFGIGPDTPIGAEANYVDDNLTMRSLVGIPLGKRSAWRAKIAHTVSAVRISDGPIRSLPGISAAFPGIEPGHRHQNSNLSLGVDYDTRDHDVTTTEGSYAGVFAETSQPAIASQYAYEEYTVDLRHFQLWDTERAQVTAGMLRFQQVQGEAPFWLLPQLGGKYVHRGYGEGRFTDRGMLTAQLEHRITFYSVRMAGVTTQFEAAPFAGLGTAFSSPERMAARYARPVIGAAIRAVARPQVVGSVDLGVGQEGLTAFMDVNYSW